MGPFKKRVIELLTSINDNLTKLNSSGATIPLTDLAKTFLPQEIPIEEKLQDIEDGGKKVPMSKESAMDLLRDAGIMHLLTSRSKKPLSLENKEYELYLLLVNEKQIGNNKNYYFVIPDLLGEYSPRKFKIKDNDLINLLRSEYDIDNCDEQNLSKTPVGKGTVSLRKDGSIANVKGFKLFEDVESEPAKKFDNLRQEMSPERQAKNKQAAEETLEDIPELDDDEFYPKRIRELEPSLNEFIEKLKPKCNIFKISKKDPCFTKDYVLKSVGYKPATLYKSNANSNINKRIVARVLECAIAKQNVPGYTWENAERELGKNYDFYYESSLGKTIKVDYKSTIDTGMFAPTQNVDLGLPIHHDKLSSLVDVYFFYSIWDDAEDFHFIHRGWCHKPRIGFLIQKFHENDSYDNFGIEHIFFFEDKGFYKIKCNSGLLNL